MRRRGEASAQVKKAFVIGAAIALAVVPIPRPTVERWYSTRLYPVVQGLLTRFSNLAPIALFDVLIVAVVVWFGWRLAHDTSESRRERRLTARHGWLRLFLRLAVRFLTTAAALYVAFLITWGFNYR